MSGIDGGAVGINTAPGTMTPPPIPVEPAFMIAVNGAATGPFTISQLVQMAASRQLTARSMVWQQGMAAWLAASQVPILASLFVVVPPPIQPRE